MQTNLNWYINLIIQYKKIIHLTKNLLLIAKNLVTKNPINKNPITTNPQPRRPLQAHPTQNNPN